MLFAPKEKGQGVVEYALIILLVVIVGLILAWYFAQVFEGICNWIRGG